MEIFLQYFCIYQPIIFCCLPCCSKNQPIFIFVAKASIHLFDLHFLLFLEELNHSMPDKVLFRKEDFEIHLLILLFLHFFSLQLLGSPMNSLFCLFSLQIVLIFCLSIEFFLTNLDISSSRKK